MCPPTERLREAYALIPALQPHWFDPCPHCGWRHPEPPEQCPFKDWFEPKRKTPQELTRGVCVIDQGDGQR